MGSEVRKIKNLDGRIIFRKIFSSSTTETIEIKQYEGIFLHRNYETQKINVVHDVA